MKKTVLHFTFLVLLASTSLFAQTLPVDQILALESDMIKMNDSVYVARFEVTNEQYSRFLKKNGAEKRTRNTDSLQIDSLGWTRYMNNMQGMSVYYRHKSYTQYPVVGIYYKGAQEYCNWLTKEYNATSERKYKKVIFRLPTELEWEYAAKAGNKNQIYAWEGVEIMDKKGNFFCNFQDLKYANPPKSKHQKKGNSLQASDHFITTSPVKSFQPNQWGIYNMSGNVAEMTLEKGYSKGGSWFSPREKVEISQFEMYEGREPFLGFRIFMEVVE